MINDAIHKLINNMNVVNNQINIFKSAKLPTHLRVKFLLNY